MCWEGEQSPVRAVCGGWDPPEPPVLQSPTSLQSCSGPLLLFAFPLLDSAQHIHISESPIQNAIVGCRFTVQEKTLKSPRSEQHQV